jgi:hypothetical protein
MHADVHNVAVAMRDLHQIQATSQFSATRLAAGSFNILSFQSTTAQYRRMAFYTSTIIGRPAEVRAYDG